MPRILCLLLLAPLAASCAAAGSGDRLVLPQDQDPNHAGAAQREAAQICASRGKRAQFVAWQNAQGELGRGGLPDVIYNCVAGAPIGRSSG